MSRKDKEEALDTKVDLLRERLKDSNDFKVHGDVFDERTLMNLYSLAKKGEIDSFGGAISTGKEANLFLAKGAGGYLAVKIYRIATSDFKSMQDYIAGDPRFGSLKGTKRAVVGAWTKKEYRNLLRAEEAGVRVPHPNITRENILIMEFIGQDDRPSPMLKDADLSIEDATAAYDKIIEFIVLLYKKASLIHADLSEFNILYNEGPVIIDMGQSVTLEHPMAGKFLSRDISNIARFFKKRFDIGSEEEIWRRIRESKPA
jgi:RIO kinase 1